MYKLIEGEEEAIRRLEEVTLLAHIRLQPKALLSTFGLPNPLVSIQNSHVVYVFVEEESDIPFVVHDLCLSYNPTKKTHRKARVPFVISSLPNQDCSQFANWLAGELKLTSEFIAYARAKIIKKGESRE